MRCRTSHEIAHAHAIHTNTTAPNSLSAHYRELSVNRPTTVFETQRLVDKVAGRVRLAGSLDRYLCDAEFSDHKRRGKLGPEGVEDGRRVSEEVGMAVFLSVLV